MEDQRTEWKESWKDDYLKTICAFANTEGGILKIGVDDRGNTIGVDEPEKLLKLLPDKIRSRLGIVPSVEVEFDGSSNVVSVRVKKSPSSVSLDGRFYVRSGSTTQMITGRELEAYMIDRIGESWTEMPVPGVSVEDLEPESIIQFRNLGIDSGRITVEEGSMSRENLMDKLGLMKDGMLNRAAVLLFHPNPGRILGPVSLKIGMFDGSDLLYQDEFSGPLIFLPNRVVDTLVTKYMYRPIGYEGITRTEAWPYSLPAIREAVLNAIVHNDYSSHVPIQIKVETDSLTIYNEGNLPNGWTVDKLMGQHKSLPRNPSLATVFYRTGSIEAFGRGIGKIMAQYEDRPGFRPVFESGAGFSVTFRNEAPFHMAASGRDASAERGSVSDYLGANGSGTYEEIADGTGLSIRQVQRLAKKLSDSGLVVKEKKGRRTVLRFTDKTE